MIERLEQAAGRPIPRETFEKIHCFVDLLEEGNERQNLVSKATLGDVWDRHIIDSAQLVRYEPSPGSSWVDIGSGAGLPGIVIACLVSGPVTLVEPRRLRAEFLHSVSESLEIGVRIMTAKVERLDGRFDVITGRAVASLPRFLEISHHLSTRNSRWVLPKGRNAQSELADALHSWQGSFHVEPSVTDAESFIIVGTGVRARQ